MVKLLDNVKLQSSPIRASVNLSPGQLTYTGVYTTGINLLGFINVAPQQTRHGFYVIEGAKLNFSAISMMNLFNGNSFKNRGSYFTTKMVLLLHTSAQNTKIFQHSSGSAGMLQLL